MQQLDNLKVVLSTPEAKKSVVAILFAVTAAVVGAVIADKINPATEIIETVAKEA